MDMVLPSSSLRGLATIFVACEAGLVENEHIRGGCALGWKRGGGCGRHEGARKSRCSGAGEVWYVRTEALREADWSTFAHARGMLGDAMVVVVVKCMRLCLSFMNLETPSWYGGLVIPRAAVASHAPSRSSARSHATSSSLTRFIINIFSEHFNSSLGNSERRPTAPTDATEHLVLRELTWAFYDFSRCGYLHSDPWY